MKKKTYSNNLITKPYLKRELKREIYSLEKRLDKKFDRRFDLTERVLRAEIATSVSETKEELKEYVSQATDKILTRIDPVLKEVLASREERTIVAHQVSELRDQADNHEERIEKLETTKIAA